MTNEFVMIVIIVLLLAALYGILKNNKVEKIGDLTKISNLERELFDKKEHITILNMELNKSNQQIHHLVETVNNLKMKDTYSKYINTLSVDIKSLQKLIMDNEDKKNRKVVTKK